jgi:hypothetical protein
VVEGTLYAVGGHDGHFAGLNSKGLSKCVRAIGSSSHRGPVISERKKSGSDPGQFHYSF